MKLEEIEIGKCYRVDAHETGDSYDWEVTKIQLEKSGSYCVIIRNINSKVRRFVSPDSIVGEEQPKMKGLVSSSIKKICDLGHVSMWEEEVLHW